MEDFFEASVGVLFDEPTFAHGEAGGTFFHTFKTYLRSLFSTKNDHTSTANASRTIIDNNLISHTITLHLPDISPSNTSLMAQYVWNSSLILCSRIASGIVDVSNALAIEVGAGAGLLGVTAGLCGASGVVMTDYPDDKIVEALERNGKEIFGEENRKSNSAGSVFWEVLGHKWGDEDTIQSFVDLISPKQKLVIFLADVLWIPDGHNPLLQDLSILLSHPNSVAHVAAGLHTGRRVVDGFIRSAESKGFTCKKIGEVRVRAGVDSEEMFEVVEGREIKTNEERSESSTKATEGKEEKDEDDEDDEYYEDTRRPPGGHSTISFGDDSPADVTPAGSPSGIQNHRQTTSSIIGQGSDAVATSPSKTGRRMASASHSRSSVIFGDDTSSSVGSDDGGDVGAVGGLVGSQVAAGISSSAHPGPKRSEKRHVPGKSGNRSSVVFGEPSGDSTSSNKPPPPRTTSPSILPYEDAPAARQGRKKPDGVAPNFKSNFSLTHQYPAPTAAPKVEKPGLRSSLIFGDDSPPDPNFGPKKIGKSTGRRIITPPGGSSSMSLAEFAGALPSVGKSAEAESASSSAKPDPAAMSPAGRTTGKHRIY
ncbi:hypothetical protein HDU97_001085 [Phlyctochytrium planicorne]|nr:hypothetical protein HDU97_001085 [Phlyctochytrium planicorne]